MKKFLGQFTLIRAAYVGFNALKQQYGLFSINGMAVLIRYFNEYLTYQSSEKNSNFVMSPRYFYPCLIDRTLSTPIEPTYFYQDSWGARKIFEHKPNHHYDIGSSAKTIGIISQFVPTTMIDIRPIDLQLDQLSFSEGSILQLPFANNSVESLSSLCVVEHIGLGRYGDPLDPWGSEKAIKELKRVLKLNGNLYFSVPVDQECRVYFNAHRAFTRTYILALFEDLNLIEEKYIYDRFLYDTYDPAKGFGTGLYHFKKEKI